MPLSPLQLLLNGGRRPQPTMDNPVSDANQSLDLFGLQGQFGDEAALNAASAVQAGQNPEPWDRRANIWKGGQAQTYAGMQPSPYLQDQASAINEGFGDAGNTPLRRVADMGDVTGAPAYEQSSSALNPIQQRNIYKRQMEQEKMRQPIQQTAMEQAGSTQRQNIQAESAKYTADTNYDMATDRATQYNELAAMMRANGQTPTGVTLPSKSGGGSFRFAPEAKPIDQRGMLSQIAVAAGNLEKEGRDPWESFGNPRSQSEAEFNQLVNNVLSTSNFGPDDADAKQNIIGFLRDPSKARLPLEQLFNSPFDETVPPEERATPQEWAALVNFFTKVRGY